MEYLSEEKFIKDLGKKIKHVRIQKGMSQVYLCKKIKIQISQLSRIERGIINTSVSQIYNIAKGLNVPMSELFLFDNLPKHIPNNYTLLNKNVFTGNFVNEEPKDWKYKTLKKIYSKKIRKSSKASSTPKNTRTEQLQKNT